MTIQDIVNDWMKNNPEMIGLVNKPRNCKCFKDQKLFFCGATVLDCVATCEMVAVETKKVLLINVTTLSKNQDLLLSNVLMKGKDIEKSFHKIEFSFYDLDRNIDELDRLASKFDYLIVDMPIWLALELSNRINKCECKWAEYSILLPTDNSWFYFLDGSRLS